MIRLSVENKMFDFELAQKLLGSTPVTDDYMRYVRNTMAENQRVVVYVVPAGRFSILPTRTMSPKEHATELQDMPAPADNHLESSENSLAIWRMFDCVPEQPLNPIDLDEFVLLGL